MKKPLAATLIAATTLGSVAAGATVFGPALAGAQDSNSPAPSTAPGPDAQRDGPAAHVTEALQPLVDNGTLTDSQVQAVVDALRAARPDKGQFANRGPGRPNLDNLAEVLGTDAKTLGQELRSGQSLADVAAANGVDPQDVVDAIVANMETRIQEGVDSGRLGQDRADEMLANAETRATDIVEGNVKPGGPRGHRGPGNGGPGFGGPDGPTGDAAGA